MQDHRNKAVIITSAAIVTVLLLLGLSLTWADRVPVHRVLHQGYSSQSWNRDLYVVQNQWEWEAFLRLAYELPEMSFSSTEIDFSEEMFIFVSHREAYTDTEVEFIPPVLWGDRIVLKVDRNDWNSQLPAVGVHCYALIVPKQDLEVVLRPDGRKDVTAPRKGQKELSEVVRRAQTSYMSSRTEKGDLKLEFVTEVMGQGRPGKWGYTLFEQQGRIRVNTTRTPRDPETIFRETLLSDGRYLHSYYPPNWGHSEARKSYQTWWTGTLFLTSRNLAWWNHLTIEAYIAGEEDIQDTPCWVVQEDGEHNELTLWVSKDSYEVLQGRWKLIRDVPTPEWTIRNSDFKEVFSGWRLPHESEVLQDGTVVQTITLVSGSSDNEVDPDLFRPKGKHSPPK